MFLLFYPANQIFKDLYIIFSYINPWNYAWKAHAINTTWLMHMPVADKIYRKQTNLGIIISLYHPYKSSQLFWHFNYKVTLPVLKYCGLCNRSFHLALVMSLATVEASFYNPSPLQRQKVNKRLNSISIKLDKKLGQSWIYYNTRACKICSVFHILPLPSISSSFSVEYRYGLNSLGGEKQVVSSGAVVPEKWWFLKAACKGQKLQNNPTDQFLDKGLGKNLSQE